MKQRGAKLKALDLHATFNTLCFNTHWNNQMSMPKAFFTQSFNENSTWRKCCCNVL